MDDILEDVRLKKKKRSRSIWKIFKVLFGIFLATLVVVFILASFAFFRFKNVYDSAVLGKASLEYSLSNAKRGDLSEMIEAAVRAEGYFNEILREIKSSTDNFLFRSTGFTRDQIADVEYLAKSASIISRSMAEAGRVAQEIDDVMSGRMGESFSQFSQVEKRQLLKTIYEAGPELNGIKANLELALMNLERIKADVLFLPVKDEIDNVKSQLSQGVESLSHLVLASQLAPEMFGYPDNSHFLVLFQNSSELRPTGGFLGTYGILETANGDIVRFDTHDIYHMDMPMEAGGLLNIRPPEPIGRYLNDSWYMRDSNWSPDWPTAARQIEWFYHKENDLLPENNKINDFNGEFSGIVAITPGLVEDLLSLVGPVEIDGEVFSADDFFDTLEYKVEQDFVNQNISSWERKEVVGDILEKIKVKMFDLHYSNWQQIGKIVEENIEQKDILVYFNNKNLQSLARELGAAGQVKDVEGDYLMVVDANMAALKTDSAMERDIKYSVKEDNGRLVADLELEYTNNGVYDWKTGDYHTYTRVYVPLGSELIEFKGSTKGKPLSGKDLGKTYFAGFLSVRVGQSEKLHLRYELPKYLKESLDSGNYDLFVQKQPGKEVNELIVDFKAENKVKSYNPSESVKVLNGNNISWDIDLSTDKVFEINF